MTPPRFYNCYQDQDQDPGLTPKTTRLVFKAMIYHGMGHQENQWIRVGADDTKQWDVLWLRTDWDEGIVPLIWVAKGTLRGRALWTGLVHAWFAAAKVAERATDPPYSEFTPVDNTLLDEEDIQAIAQQVWPGESEEDHQE
jgi:hypothetical protein